ncbi:hypothetical protein HDU97_000844 [Phlyctochytrium planicorne]|nr:hypothetical protein HDU97_000844 [Phlyctochytrium planicorne]
MKNRLGATTVTSSPARVPNSQQRRNISKRAIASTAVPAVEALSHAHVHHPIPPTIIPAIPPMLLPKTLPQSTRIPTQKPEATGSKEALPAVSVGVRNGHLDVNFGGHVGSSSFQPVWLRDHCKCPKCYHAGTKQRLLSTVDISKDIRVQSATLSKDFGSVQITWPDGHESKFDLAWLKTHSYNPRVSESTDFARREHKLWGAELIRNLPTVPYKEIMASDEGLAKWLSLLDTYGIAFASGVPPTPEDTEKLARRICFIRETHYGTFWDFTPNNAHGDTAYTSLALPAHTDSTYFTDPVGLQLFHLIEFNGVGGKSLYVDGFNVAHQLKQRHPWAYEALTRIRIPCHAAGDANVVMAPTPRHFPILVTTPATGTSPGGELYQVRFNNDDRSTLSNLTAAEVDEFYAALREWTALLRHPANELWVQLEPGMTVVVDNWRALHGRSSFTGHRRMVGSYHNWDDYRSRVRDLCYGRLGRADL